MKRMKVLVLGATANLGINRNALGAPVLNYSLYWFRILMGMRSVNVVGTMPIRDEQRRVPDLR